MNPKNQWVVHVTPGGLTEADAMPAAEVKRSARANFLTIYILHNRRDSCWRDRTSVVCSHQPGSVKLRAARQSEKRYVKSWDDAINLGYFLESRPVAGSQRNDRD